MANTPLFLRALAVGLAAAVLIPTAAFASTRPGPLLYVDGAGQLISLPPAPST